MNFLLRLFLVIAIIIYFLVIYFLLKRKTLLLKYTLIWILSGFCMLLIILCPKFMIYITHFLGIVEVPNALFAIFLFFLLLISISITAIVSALSDKNKQLIQQCGILEMRIRHLEQELIRYRQGEGEIHEDFSNNSGL